MNGKIYLHAVPSNYSLLNPRNIYIIYWIGKNGNLSRWHEQVFDPLGTVACTSVLITLEDK